MSYFRARGISTIQQPMGLAAEVDSLFAMVRSKAKAIGQPSEADLALPVLWGLPPGLVSINNPSVTEGNAGTTNMTFVVTLASAQTRNVTFEYLTQDGTAVAGVDYQAVSGTRTILAGQLSTNIDVPVIGDTLSESNETFSLRLTNLRYS